jgi:UDP-2-acetamido-3-amino-2,3-dideoxy-glucuronate N-acetyltransferase
MPIRQPIIIEGECEIGENLDTGYFVVLRRCIIGNNVCVWSHSIIDPGAIIGHRTKIHAGCYIAQATVIENNVFLGPGVVITNDRHPVRTNPDFWEPVRIKRGAKIGANVTLLPGITIGENALIGAGSVVTKDVPDNEIWVGNPARKLR